MLAKAFEQKCKWLLIGLCSGILSAIFLPEILIGYRLDREQIKYSLNEEKPIRFNDYSNWPLFLTDPSFDLNSWQKNCWNQSSTFPSDDPQVYLKKNHTAYPICKKIVDLLHSIYKIETKVGSVRYPEKFAQKILLMFHGDLNLFSQALEQKLYFIINKFSFEHTVYNPLRGRRPIQPPEVPIEQYLNETIEKSSRNCDLCNYKNMTAFDPLGRLETAHAYSAANAFKFDEWHSLFMPKQHDITKLTFEEMKDVFTLAWKWIRNVHQHSTKHRFASILWDNLPHGGASQVHPHIHATVHTDHYYGQFEMLRYAAERFHRENKKEKNFFRTIQDIHMALNLTISMNGLTLLVPITSHKEFDLILLAENFDERVIETIYKIIQGYFHQLGQYSFSSCLYLPPLSSNIDERGLTPVYYRIIPRGQASSLLSEVSSLDLLSIYNVNRFPSDIYREVIHWFS